MVAARQRPIRGVENEGLRARVDLQDPVGVDFG
jgi:hypothetical protein